MPDNGAAKRRNRNILVGVLALLVGIGGGVAVWSVTKDDSSSGQAAGEIILSPAADVGPDPFSAQPFAAEPDPALAQQATPVSTPITAPAVQAVTATPGGTEGLYGGTKDKAACDPQKMVDFLAANPDKAAAWVAALNADPNVKLPNGDPLTVATIPDYVASLTPIVLLQDTRVTNHGFKNGKPTALQSVLQKGSAVLVDNLGVPRVKCYCGNPLLPPVAAKTTPKYVGNTWPDFNPTKISIVQNNTTVINNFIVKDLKTGTTFTQKAGSTITSSTTTSTTTPGSTTTAPTAPTTSAGPTTTAPAGLTVFEGTWTMTPGKQGCQLNGGTCAPAQVGTATWTCSSATTCTSDTGKVYTVADNRMEWTGPSKTPFTCDGKAVPTTDQITYVYTAGTIEGVSSSTAPAVPPSCPLPFEKRVEYTGTR